MPNLCCKNVNIIVIILQSFLGGVMPPCPHITIMKYVRPICMVWCNIYNSNAVIVSGVQDVCKMFGVKEVQMS